MARLQKEDINLIRQSVDIVDVISQYINIERKGRNYVALCPFHDDNNPSLTISPDKQIYKCFVCNAGGNVFTFISDYQKINFVEAVVEVGKFADINLDIDYPTVDYIKDDKKVFYEIINEAKNYFNYQLKNTNDKIIIDYLAKRNLDNDIIDYFEIGYESDHSVVKFLERKKYNTNDLISVNIVNQTDYNTISTFNNRLVFPISDQYGNTVAFSGRTLLADDNVAKYINSNENIIYSKSDILYNYHRVKEIIKDYNEVFVVEGVLDAIAFYKAGLKNVIATLGTNLSLSQVQLLKRLNCKVILAFDGDSAGIRATSQALMALLKDNVKTEILVGFKDLDPDDYLSLNGKAKFKEASIKTLGSIDFLINYYKGVYNLNNFEDRKNYVLKLNEYLVNVREKFDYQYFVDEMSKATGFNNNQIKQILNVNKVRVPKATPKKTINLLAENRAEFNILGQMLSSRGAAMYIKDKLGFLLNSNLNKLYLLLLEYYYENDDMIVADFISKVENDNVQLSPLLLLILNNDIVIKEYNKDIIDESINLIKVRMIDKKIFDIKNKVVLSDEEKAEIALEIAKLSLEKAQILQKVGDVNE